MAEIRRATAPQNAEFLSQTPRPLERSNQNCRRIPGRSGIGVAFANLKKNRLLLNATVVALSLLLYFVTMGWFGAGISSILGDWSPLLTRTTTTTTSSNHDEATTTTTTAQWIGTDWHAIHYKYLLYMFPRKSFDALAGEYARAPPQPPSRDHWNVPPPPLDDIQAGFDHTIQPAKGGPTVDVVIGVLVDESYPGGLERRNTIRETWGGATTPTDSNKKRRYKNTVFFVVGGSHITDDLEREMLQYQDLVWVQTSEYKLASDHVKTMVFNAAAVKYIPTLRHVLVVEDTSYVRVSVLEEASAKQLKDVDYFGHCMPNVRGNELFYSVPKALQEQHIFPYPSFPKAAMGAFMVTWKIARCVSHIASAVPPLPVSAGVNMAVMARDCRVPCTHDERVQRSGTQNFQNMLIHLNVTDLREFHETATDTAPSMLPFMLPYQPQNMPFP